LRRADRSFAKKADADDHPIAFARDHFALWLLVHSGGIQYWHLLVTSSLLGLVNTLDMPLRQSFVVEMVGHDDLMNAIALIL
jgi:hypothetical protein